MPQFGPSSPQDAPLDASYVVLSASGDMPNERVLTAGTSISLTDSGAGGALTVDVTTIDASQIDSGLIAAARLGDGGGSATKYLAGDQSWEPYIAYTEVLANRVYAGPTSGLSDLPSFRALVADDIPSLSASKITSGTLDNARLDTQLQSVAGLSYSGNALKVIRVDAGETGFELATVSAGVTDHGALSGLLDDDHGVYIYTIPGASNRNEIAPVSSDVQSLTLKASSGTFSSAYDVFSVESHTGTDVFAVNKTAASAYSINLNTNASSSGTTSYILADAHSGRTSGWINLSSTAFGDGGYLDLSGGGDVAAHSGYMDLSGGTDPSAAGGFLNLSGGTAAGGSINASNGGGDIVTNGSTGSIGLGVAATRTSLIGSGSAVACTLPAVTGTLASLAGTQTFTGTKTFADTTLKLGGAGAGTATITYANSASSRTYTFPDFGGNTSVVLAATSTTATQALFASTTAGAPAYRAIAVTDLSDGIISFAKIQDINTDKLLGRDSASTGDVEELGVSGGIEFTGSGGIQTSAFTGDVTKTAGGTALTIANDAVTYSKMQNVSSTDKVLGRSSSGSGDVEEIACTSAGRALIDDATAADQRTTLGLGPYATVTRAMIAGGATVTTSGTAWANVTGLSFSLAANEVCIIWGYIFYKAGNTVSGLNLSFTDPTGCSTDMRWEAVISTGAGAFRTSVADDTSTAQTGTASTTTYAPATFVARVINGANSGNWQLRFASETADAVVITIDQYSCIFKQTLA